MLVGNRLKELREQKKLSQGDIEKRTGLVRCYVSRVENGHTVPAIETLEKFARALEVPVYHIVYDGIEPPALPAKTPLDASQWGSAGQDARYLTKLRTLLGRMKPDDRKLILHMAEKVARR